MINFKNIVKDRTVEIYDSSINIAKSVTSYGASEVTFYAKTPQDTKSTNVLTVKEFLTPTAATNSAVYVCMLDGSTIKLLAVRYPGAPQYLLARIAPQRSWLIGMPGLLRRIVLRRVALRGIVRVTDINGKGSYWLVIARIRQALSKNQLFFPKKMGVQHFINWLNESEIEYVIPRFYEQLPEIHRMGGDIDLLVADSQADRVREYILEHSKGLSGNAVDSIRIGLHAVTNPNGIPYYPPHLTRKILENAIEGPVGAKVPLSIDALNAFIYHVLYHSKGYTNIPSMFDGKAEHPPENDYAGIIKQKAAGLAVNVGETMEEMDEYMSKVGWRPKPDVLAKIAKKNPWVRDRFFGNDCTEDSGLVVLILKEIAIERKLLDPIVEHLESKNLKILRTSVLSEEQKQHATDHVRGGNWVDNKGNIKGLLPAAIIVAVDMKCANLNGKYIAEFERTRITEMKRKLRNTFDNPNEASLVHSADTTSEAWTYIEACLPEDAEAIHRDVKSATHTSTIKRLRQILSPSFAIHTLRYKLRDLLVHRFLNI